MALTPSGVDKSDDSADSMVEKGINFGGLEEAFCAKEVSYDVRDIVYDCYLPFVTDLNTIVVTERCRY